MFNICLFSNNFKYSKYFVEYIINKYKNVTEKNVYI